MRKTNILLSVFVASLMSITVIPKTFANNSHVETKNNSLITSVASTPTVVDYLQIKDKLEFKDFKFEKDRKSNLINFDSDNEIKIKSYEDFKLVIDDTLKQLRLSFTGKTYIFPYVKVDNQQMSGLEITTLNGLNINFNDLSEPYNTTYISSIKPISLSAAILKSHKYFTDYKEEFKKVFVRAKSLNDDSVQELMCYLYLNDKKSFDDWLDDNEFSLIGLLKADSSFEDAQNSDIENASIYYDDESQFKDLSNYFKLFGLDIKDFIDDSYNFDTTIQFDDNKYKKLRAQFIKALNKDSKIKNLISSKANSANTKVITVCSNGLLDYDNGFGEYLKINKDYFPLEEDNYNILSIKVIPDGDGGYRNDYYTIRIDNIKDKDIYIIKYKK